MLPHKILKLFLISSASPVIYEIINPITLGQIKLYMDPVNKNPKKNFQNFDFSICKKLFLISSTSPVIYEIIKKKV